MRADRACSAPSTTPEPAAQSFFGGPMYEGASSGRLLSAAIASAKALVSSSFQAPVRRAMSPGIGGGSGSIGIVWMLADPTLPQPLKLALELMHNNIDEPLKVDEIAACVEISVRQLERQFCRHVNATPSRYYLELRLTRARQLLQQTNKSLADIAVACGFVSISHFRRCFREFFDIAPGCFRAGVRKG